MSVNLPYVPGYGVIARVLEKVKSAATPARFTQDFLATKLGFKGGNAKAVIPYLKRTGFIGSDGAPTDLYKRFRNPSQTGAAAAEALRHGYKPLYEVNEYAHDLSDKDLKGVIVQITGQEPDSTTVKVILGSFKALKSFAKFDQASDEPKREETKVEETHDEPSVQLHAKGARLGLSYTINLNLPATSDIAVFNAIFKSLRDHLLR